jgi:branched-chain amino acid transport system permease protein
MVMQILASGLVFGCVLALVALGFSLVYSASGIANFAAGEFVMMGGVVSAAVITAGGVSPVLALPVAIGTVALLGVIMDRFAILQARRRSAVTLVMITIGMAIVFRGLMLFAAGKSMMFPPGLGGIPPVTLLGATISGQGVWVVLAVVCVSAGMWYLLERTWLGRAMRATSENPRAATLVGISPRLISTTTFAIAGALGALAGVLVAPISSMSYDSGLFFGIKGFAAAVLGGLGNPVGAVVGGLVLGFVEALAAGYLASAYKDVVALIVLVLVLSVRPSGILGNRVQRRV